MDLVVQKLKIITEPSFLDGQIPLREAELWGSEREQRKEQWDLEVLSVNNNSATNLLCDSEKVT